eukprot:CAMPEP_0116841590 /NCGR_PEP_ID=MMETSP0418-20121206/11022_1 /TAXON_ID=1158023 /ORGANISM="Astrosyne radiata, Strain 13vi08-1A" /LENGTH=428 /DNA_ID=CAMNT_0004472059 /DNA_START=399 /DNA_END=1685 /DNA_ORIENTATION=+
MNSWWARCLLLASSLPAWSRVTSFSPSTCSRRVKTSLDMVWGEPAPERYRLPIAKKTEYDWREYRAYLVRDADEISVEEEARALERSDPKLAKQSELGNAFADALLSIFQKERRQNNNNNSHRINNNHRINIHNNSPEMRKKTTKKRSSRGHLVVKPSTASVLTDGNPNRSWIHEANIETQEDVTAFGGKQMLSLLEEQRMMPLAKKKAVTRTLPKTFAHLLPYAEVGSVLLSSECLSGNFHQTVVLIVEQSEERGTIGVIINRPLQLNLRGLVAHQKSVKLEISTKMTFGDSPVANGGPIHTDVMNVLHTNNRIGGAKKLLNGVYVGGEAELLDEVRMGNLDPRNVLFVRGHAQWTPGQLNRELEKKVWYPASVSKDFILRYARDGQSNSPSKNLWAEIMTELGGEYAELAQDYARGFTDYRQGKKP